MRVVVAHFGIDHGGYVQLQLQSFALSDLIVLTYNEAAGYIFNADYSFQHCSYAIEALIFCFPVVGYLESPKQAVSIGIGSDILSLGRLWSTWSYLHCMLFLCIVLTATQGFT